MAKVTHEFDLFGKHYTLETGELAKQATGECLVSCGESTVNVTVVVSKERKNYDFFPLTVDYEEKMYAAGKIPGGFIKREGRPSSDAVLCARLIDRPIRPLFPEGFRNDVQIVATVLCVEQDNPPEIAAMLGASCALTVSDIPFMGPIAGVRVGYINGEFVINPTEEQRADSDLNLTVAGSYDAVMMVEAGANELSEEIVLDAILPIYPATGRVPAEHTTDLWERETDSFGIQSIRRTRRKSALLCRSSSRHCNAKQR